MKMFRAVPKDGFNPTKVYTTPPTCRTPSNVPYLVDNVWEWLRPVTAPSRRFAAYASPTPELALANASAVGANPALYQVCEVVFCGGAPLVAHLSVTDARLHEDISRIVRFVAKGLGPEFSNMPIEVKAAHAALYLPAVAREELDTYFARDDLSIALAEDLRAISTFWSDTTNTPRPHDGELFFTLPPGVSYQLTPVSTPLVRGPEVRDRVRFKNDLIATFTNFPSETWALAGEEGQIIGTERPGNLELFWVKTSRKSAFQVNMREFDVIPASTSAKPQ
jgi:hypothetical protein